MEKLTTRCKHAFNAGDRNRGRDCFNSNCVVVIDWEDTALIATVAGSCSKPYDIFISWINAERDCVIEVNCTCPRFAEGYKCKHLWATLLEMDDMGLSYNIPDRGNLEVLATDWTEFSTSSSAENLAFQKFVASAFSSQISDLINGTVLKNKPAKKKTVKKKAAKKKSQKPIVPTWQKTIAAIELASASFSSHNSYSSGNLLSTLVHKKREVWYILNMSRSVYESSLIIEFYQRETKKNGEFGKIKRFRLDEDIVESISNTVDRKLLAQLINFADDSGYDSSYDYWGYSHRQKVEDVDIPQALYDYFLPRIAETGRFVWMLDSENQPFEEANPLAWGGTTPWEFSVSVTPDKKKKQWVITGTFSRDGETRGLQEAVLTTPTGLILIDDTISLLNVDIHAYHWLLTLTKNSYVSVPFKDRDSFLKQLLSATALPKMNLPPELQWEEISLTPQPKLKIHSPSKGYVGRAANLTADVSFLYGTTEVSVHDTQFAIPVEEEEIGTLPNAKRLPSSETPQKNKNQNGKALVKKAVAKKTPAPPSTDPTRIFVRDKEAEKTWIEVLRTLGASPQERYYGRKGDVRFSRSKLGPLVDLLIQKGWKVEAEGKLYRSAGDFKINVKTDIDWFELDASFDFDGLSATLPELLTAVRKGEKYVELGDGTRGMLPEAWLKRYQHLADLGSIEDDKVRFKPSQALLLDALLDEKQENLSLDKQFRQFRKKLRSFDGVKPKQEPKTFQGELRDYQRDGLGWFHFLRELGLGGCLADDMGLGKTIQVLALLENRRKRRLKKDETRYPTLVVAPKSLIFNWIDEAKHFTPKLKVADYTGTDRKQRVGDFNDYDLIITTYGTMRIDIATLKDQRFDYTILDESQAIKNGNSQAAKASRLLNGTHRLTLTGTPIENHLGELWSMFEYLNPGMLGRTGAFASLCKNAKPGEEGGLADLAKAVAPFILRRTKDQVLTELPEKTEQMIYVDLLPKQRKQYNDLRDYYRAKLTKKIDEKGLKQSKIHVLEALLRLRQAACHPGLVDKNKVKQPSAKLEILLEQIQEITKEGHKALVFSQFTSLLAIVKEKLDEEKIVYEYLDGKTRNRKAKVERFQTEKECPLFLISLKAGGSGLNLTAADYVFILDPWWNPAVEAQAIDRTHRIGQTQSVFAYRIIARDTVEEKVLKLQASKRDLANAIITADESLIRNLTADDLKMILE